jgi:hypothetical protein
MDSVDVPVTDSSKNFLPKKNKNKKQKNILHVRTVLQPTNLLTIAERINDRN